MHHHIQTQFATMLDCLEDFADNHNEPLDEGQEMLADIAYFLDQYPDAPAILDYHRRAICHQLIANHLGEDHKIGAVWVCFLRDCLQRIEPFHRLRVEMEQYHGVRFSREDF